MKTTIALLAFSLIFVGCGGGGSSPPPIEPPKILPVGAVIILKTGQEHIWSEIIVWDNQGDRLVVEGHVSYEIGPGTVKEFDQVMQYDACQIDTFFSVPTLDLIDQDPFFCNEEEE